jgi:hypothetical protein
MKRQRPRLFEKREINGVELEDFLRWIMIAAILISPSYWLGMLIGLFIKPYDEEELL